MPPTFRAANSPPSFTTNARINGVSWSINKPAGTAAGDLLVLFAWVYAINTGNYTSPSTGWTRVTAVGDNDFGLWTKKATESEPSSYTITSSSTAVYDTVAALLCYTDVDWSSPSVDLVGAATSGTSAAPFTQFNLGPQDLNLIFYLNQHLGTQGNTAAPSGWTSRSFTKSPGTGNSTTGRGTCSIQIVEKRGDNARPTTTSTVAGNWEVCNMALTAHRTGLFI